jgi:hypothetical protein
MADIRTNGQSPPALCHVHSRDIKMINERQIRMEHTQELRDTRTGSRLKAIEKKLDRVIEGMRIGNIEPVPVTNSFVPDFDPDEQTNPGIHVDAAKLWKGRTTKALDLKDQAEIALTREKAKARKVIIAAVCTGAAMVLTAIAAIVQAWRG